MLTKQKFGWFQVRTQITRVWMFKGGWLRLKWSSQSTAVGRMSGRAGEGQECMLCLPIE